MFGLPALIAYGAVILSFVGAVHWGFAIGGGEMVPRQVAVRLFLGVLPSLVGWSAMLLELSALPERALLLLIGGFAGTVVIEQRWSTAGFVPPGYMLLRWTVTVAVVLILALVLTLRLAGNPIVL